MHWWPFANARILVIFSLNMLHWKPQTITILEHKPEIRYAHHISRTVKWDIKISPEGHLKVNSRTFEGYLTAFLHKCSSCKASILKGPCVMNSCADHAVRTYLVPMERYGAKENEYVGCLVRQMGSCHGNGVWNSNNVLMCACKSGISRIMWYMTWCFF